MQADIKTTIKLTHKFQAGHYLPDSESLTTKACNSGHGHSYGVKVVIDASKLVDNFVVDFGSIKQLIDRLDHAELVWKDSPDKEYIDVITRMGWKIVLLPYPPTAENISCYLYNLLSDNLPSNCVVRSVSLCEGWTPISQNWVVYTQEIL